MTAALLGLCLCVSSGAGPPAASAADGTQVAGLERLIPGGGRVDWSVQGDWIAYDKVGANGRYDIYIARADGTLERCLTCGPLELRKTNNINPAWHPSGDYLVFQVQDNAKRLGLDPVELSGGHRGLHSELWIIDRDGKGFFRLTDVAENGGAVLDPSFSHEGDRLLWSERVRSRVGVWGTWALRVSDFGRRRGVPRLGKPETYQPGPQKLFLSSSGFTADDRSVWLAGNREPGQPEGGMDIYRFDLVEGRLQRLTRTPRVWDEGAREEPGGSRLAWMSSGGIEAPEAAKSMIPPAMRRDLWVMSESGGDRARLTYFNAASGDHEEGLGAAIVDDFAWHPRGARLVAHVVYEQQGLLQEAIYEIRLREPLRGHEVPLGDEAAAAAAVE